MFHYQGKTALITGASSGIGKVFAEALAARGTHLVLTARSGDKLRALADGLTAQHGIRAEIIVADLSREGAPQQIFAETQQRGLNVDLLVNNAGFGTYGLFAHESHAKQHAEVTVNVTAVVDLSHLFLGPMLQRGEGGIINVASTAAFQPLPYMAVYAATKAFVLSFSEALWAEYRKRGVRVLALCPGPVDTAFFDVVGSREPAVGVMVTPEKVVEVGLRALERGKCSVIPQWQTLLLAQVPRFVPRSLVVRIAEQMFTSKNEKAVPASGTEGQSA